MHVSIVKLGRDLTNQLFSPQKVAFRKGNGPLVSGKSRLVKYYNLARCFKVSFRVKEPSEREPSINIQIDVRAKMRGEEVLVVAYPPGN